MTNITDDIIALIKEVPNITSREMYAYFPNATKSTVSSTIYNLKNKGVIVQTGKKQLQTKKGPHSFPCFQLSDNPTPLVRQRKLKNPTEAGLRAQLEDLRNKLCELEAWKREALERYPDLGVDPMTLKARAIVAEQLRAVGDNNLADLVVAGKKDETLLVKVTVRALEEGNE